MNDSGGNMSEKGIIDALGRCSRCGQHVQSTAGCDCHTRPNDAKWISVEETPPENGKRYIICGGVGYCLNGVWHTMMEINHPAIQWTVTQYMELLYHEPPKQSSGGSER
jgi:hypothetical protein